jgi:hypothetical protein
MSKNKLVWKLLSLLAVFFSAGNSLAVWDVSTIDSTGDVGWYASLTMSSANQPMIAYYDATNRHLKYARFDGSNWVCETVDTSSNCGQGASIARNTSNNYPYISYYRGSSLYVATWSGSAWSFSYVDVQSSYYINCTSIILDSSQHPNVSYNNAGVKFARYNGTSWQNMTTIANDSGRDMESSLVLSSSNTPYVAYYNNSSDNVNVMYFNGA